MLTQYSCRCGVVFAMLLLWTAGGCGDSSRSGAGRPARAPGQFASRRIPGVTVEQARSEAARVFQQHFRIDPLVSTGDMLVSRPAEATDQVGTGRVRDVLGSPNRHRLMGTLWLSQAGPDVVLQCQVRVERLDTAERAAFARETGDDRPTDTPIDRHGASSASVREEWVPAGRDRQAEASILDQVMDRLVGTQPAP